MNDLGHELRRGRGRWAIWHAPGAASVRVARTTILATACVSPPPAPFLIRVDPAERLRDYVRALAWWLDRDDLRLGPLVVLEDSGFDPHLLLSAVHDAAVSPKRSIEVLSYIGPARPDGLHYGWSEFEMIDHFLDNSSLLGRRFMKVTGRYIFPRYGRLMDLIPDSIKLAFDSVERPAFPPLRPIAKRSADVAIFIADKDYYCKHVRHLYSCMRAVPRFTHIEDVLFDQFRSAHGNGQVMCRFPVSCDPAGIGGNGEDLTNLRVRGRRALRSLSRMILPGLWL